MNIAAAEQQLAQWAGEYKHIYDPQFALPEPFMKFAGNQLAKLIDGLTPADKRNDWDVVRAMVNGSLTRIKVGRFDRLKGKLMYDFAEPGHLGMGMLNVSDVHDDDRKKLAEILDRIEGT